MLLVQLVLKTNQMRGSQSEQIGECRRKLSTRQTFHFIILVTFPAVIVVFPLAGHFHFARINWHQDQSGRQMFLKVFIAESHRREVLSFWNMSACNLELSVINLINNRGQQTQPGLNYETYFELDVALWLSLLVRWIYAARRYVLAEVWKN